MTVRHERSGFLTVAVITAGLLGGAAIAFRAVRLAVCGLHFLAGRPSSAGRREERGPFSGSAERASGSGDSQSG